MSKEANCGVKVLLKGPELWAFHWRGSDSIRGLRDFVGKLEVRILVDAGNDDLYLKWPTVTTYLPRGGWLLRNESLPGGSAFSYYKNAEEFFKDFYL